MNATAQIFLSYAREDRQKVESLYQRLSDAGFRPWTDTKDILAGEKWQRSIQHALQQSQFFLACLSVTSVTKRNYLRREFREALEKRQEMLESDIYLIPVRLEECEIPEELREHQWVDLFAEDGWTRIVPTLRGLLDDMRGEESWLQRLQVAELLINDRDQTLSRRAIAVALEALDYATEPWYNIPLSGPQGRGQAIRILGQLEPLYCDEAIIARLTRILTEDASEEVRDAAYGTLLRLTAAPEAVPEGGHH